VSGPERPGPPVLLSDGGRALDVRQRMVATMTATYVVSGAGGDIGRAVAERLAERASRAGPLTGWVNNAAVFEDAAVHVPAS
jgi:hypothetical protein